MTTTPSDREQPVDALDPTTGEIPVDVLDEVSGGGTPGTLNITD